MANNGCSTCKERKIACDRTIPVCKNCLRSKRSCKRYSIRLSWPRGNDRRRAILSSAQSNFRKGGFSIPLQFINTTSKDVEIYTHRFQLSPNSRLLEATQAYIPPPRPSLSSLPKFENDEAELLPFFFSHVLPSLPAFDVNYEKLRGIVTRFAIFDDSSLSRAVLNSLLALSANIRFGNHKQATKYIAAALKSLRLSMQKEIDLQQRLQHIVAGMLICSFEMYGFSQTSSIWIMYLSGSKGIISRFFQNGVSKNEDQKILFQWVYYCDALARIGIQHWRGYKSLRTLLEKEVGLPNGCAPHFTCEKTQVPGFSHRLLELLSDINFISELRAEDSQYHTAEHISWLEQTEDQLLSIRHDLQKQGYLGDALNQSESAAVKELFVLATLLYFERQAKRLVGSSSDTDAWMEEAFLIMSKVEYCNKPFPLLIFGRESRTDDKRLVILELIDRSLAKSNVSNLTWLREFLTKLWVHDDLGVEEDIYDRNVCSMLHGFEVVPCLL